MYGWGPGWYGGWEMGLFILFFWIVLIALIVWGIRAITGHGRYGHMHMRNAGCCAPGGNALDIARERYAKGEIKRPVRDNQKRPGLIPGKP